MTSNLNAVLHGGLEILFPRRERARGNEKIEGEKREGGELPFGTERYYLPLSGGEKLELHLIIIKSVVCDWT